MSIDSEKTNAQVMQKFYDSIFVFDWEGVEKTVAQNLTIYEAKSLPYAGEHHGIEGLKQLFATVVGYWDDLNIEVKGITTGGDYVVGVLHFSGTGKKSGKKISMPIAEIAEFENGRIKSIKPVYWDTKEIFEAIGA